MRVLVVDDDRETLEVVGRALARSGHDAVLACEPAEANAALDRGTFDVIVLDVMLEQASGLEVCRALRAEGLRTPILFLSARGSVNARVEGLDAGADDYLAKPFAIRELVARVRALGRRGVDLRSTVVTVGTLTLDLESRLATSAGREVPITRREWDILVVLAASNGRIVSYDDLLERAWGEVTDGARASLDVIISRLRRKLEEGAERSVFRTIRGQGYVMELDS